MKRDTSKKLAGALLCFLGYLPTITALDNAHFYKASRCHMIPGYEEEEWKTSFDFSYGFGQARKGSNGAGSSCNALDIYGTQNFLYMASGVPTAGSITNYANTLLTQISPFQNNPLSSPTFGTVGFKGNFEISELMFDIRQNLKDNFFLEMHLPLRLMKISDISLEDKSPTSGAYSQNTAEWISLKKNINAVLNNYGYQNYQNEYKQNDLGDLSLLIGWQHTDSESFDFLNYFDIALRTGVLFPTGGKDSTTKPFSIPSGYNGHWAIPLHFDATLGIQDCVSLGAHVGATFFFDKTRNRRLKTQTNQSGWIYLAQGIAKEEMGTLWNVGLYANFGNFYKGFSGVIGYSFDAQENSELHPRDNVTFSESIVNTDSRLLSWNQHTLHFKLDYDFYDNMKDNRYSPRVGLFYDVPVAGKRTFSTYLVGGSAGIDCCWNF